MSKLIPAKSSEVIRVFKKLGFEEIRQSGSHVVLHHPNGKWVTVPIHKGRDVAKGTLSKILKDAGLSYQEFNKMK